MKFQKFVKSIGTEGIVYNRKNGEQWLAAGDVFAKIPEDIHSVTCMEVADMPDNIETIINCDSFGDPCKLYKAVMRYPDGAIKDCVRIYATENALNTLAIDNFAYSPIEQKDFVEMFNKYDFDNEISEAKALFVKCPANLVSDEEMVGLIFPTVYEE